ncbi:MAG TPA: EscU/YscU/HrcU family type III secretion system export apparatus switch protein [Candidatus Binatus sp.]|nr:EscU/YscU/HrcU family type III secretion system export apparatus switch protein [Candidatus Binatus sp.]
MAEQGGERTERATEKRREEARRHGQVILSPEVSPVAVLLTALAIGSWGAPLVLERSRIALAGWLAAVGPTAAHDDPAGPMVVRTLLQIGAVLAPFFVATAAVGAAAVIAQVGWSVNPELVAPDAGRLSPAKGLGRIFSANGAVHLVKAVVKIVIVLGVAYRVLLRTGTEAVAAPGMTNDGILAFTGLGLRRLFLAMAGALAVLGVVDYLWQRWRHEQGLRMTRQEVKEEHKESDGDPQVRMRFRRAHREIARRRMLADVRGADVVLTNPVHVAVALRYRAAEMGAPRVVAKGAGELAQKIKDAARTAGIPIVERRALARALFKSVKLGGEIPQALYRAVAEILAYIYSLRPRPAAEARS